MIKIPTLFKRDMKTHLVYNEFVEGTEWVGQGKGYSTIKFDGTACMIKNGVLYKRLTVKKGSNPPVNAILCQPKPDAHTGQLPCWILVTDSKEDQWHREAFDKLEVSSYNKRHHKDLMLTYELVGSKINGNKLKLHSHNFTHELWPHGHNVLPDVPRDFKGLQEWLSKNMWLEGIVFYNDKDNKRKMVKIKRRDFGLKW